EQGATCSGRKICPSYLVENGPADACTAALRTIELSPCRVALLQAGVPVVGPTTLAVRALWALAPSAAANCSKHGATRARPPPRRCLQPGPLPELCQFRDHRVAPLGHAGVLRRLIGAQGLEAADPLGHFVARLGHHLGRLLVGWLLLVGGEGLLVD